MHSTTNIPPHRNPYFKQGVEQPPNGGVKATTSTVKGSGSK